MRGRRWIVLLASLQLVVACHRGGKKPTEDTTLHVPLPSQAIIEDTLPPPIADTHPPAPKPQRYRLQEDTAAVTNLRLFMRKQRTVYNPALLVGEWQHANEHEQYMADGKGFHWDASDDVNREEAQSFTWTMDSNLLTFRYQMQLGAVVLRQYVVTFVDDETLVYRDAYGGSYMWDKVPAGFTDNPTVKSI